MRLSAAVFLALMILTNLIVAFIPVSFDARFRMPRTTVRGWEQIVGEAHAAKSQGYLVVIVLGDSVGWGYASRGSEQTLAYGVQHTLQALPSDQRPAFLSKGEPKVFNLSAMSAYSADHYALLMRCLNAADLVVMQVYPGHYSEAYIKDANFPSYTELAKGLDPADPLSREMVEALPEASYPQRLLGGIEAPVRRLARTAIPLAAKKDYFLSRSGLDLTDPGNLLKSQTASSVYLPFPRLSPKLQETAKAAYAGQFQFSDGPKTARALRYYEGIAARCRERGIPLMAAVTPWSPIIREELEANPRYRARMAQLQWMTERNGGKWVDYNHEGGLGLTADDYHDYSHIIGENLVRVGEQVARDLVAAFPGSPP
ncbi:MAG: hypothetical protein KY468_17485 [Armatimonadetes bacterium]|nr:hypothetical protein [Armatimonadota bacterium]